MKFLVLLVFLTSTAFASYSEMSALNQSKTTGSFFLLGDRNVFRNPALIEQVGDKIYLESAGEMGRSYGDLLLAIGRKVNGKSAIDMVLGDLDVLDIDFALGAYIQPFNGKGIAGAGVTLGMEYEDLELYLGAGDLTNHVKFTIGTVVPWKNIWGVDKMSLYAQYAELQAGHDLIVGAALEKIVMTKVAMFADLKYEDMNKVDSLALTVGGKTMLSESWVVSASGKKEVYFGTAFRLGTGVDYYANKDVKLSLAGSASALDLPSPKYKDFDINFGISLAI